MSEKIKCLIRNKEISATKEELVRQSYLGYLLYSMSYPDNIISVEVPILHGSSEVLDVETNKKKRADIVIYENEHKEDIKVIVEVKKQKETTGEKQVKCYGNVTNARYLVWHNGSEPTKIWKRVKFQNAWKWEPIPILPRFGAEHGDIIPAKKELNDIRNIKGLFKSINSFIWVNSNIKNKKDIFLQFIYILFIKLYDEYFNESPNFYILEREYKTILENTTSKTFENRIKNLFDELKDSSDFKDIFDDTDKISLEDKLLAEIVYRLQYLKIRGADTKGEAFQLFISPYYRGENDQYLTPEPVIRMIIDILKPSLKDNILDPACGTGRFLTHTLNYVLPSLLKQNINIKNWASTHIFGIDVDRILAKISKIYMVLIGDGHTNIIRDNSLSKTLEDYALTSKEMNMVITNPPFGSSEKIKDTSVLQHYELGHKWTDDLTKQDEINTKGQSQGILMLERSYQFLKDGGRIGIVLPNGVYSNLGDEYIRKWIVTNFKIIAIISLPEETFRVKTIGANVKTSVLIAEKKSGVEKHDIFFAIPKTIGYDMYGDERDSNEVLEVAEHFHKNKEFKRKYFTLTLSNDELIDRMDASFHSLKLSTKNTFSLGETCDVFIGKTPDKENYLDKGRIKILKVRCLTNKLIDWSDKKRDYVTEEWYQNRKNETVDVQKNDIVLAAAAHVAKYIGDEVDIIDKIPSDYMKVIASAKIFVIRVRNKEELNPYVLLMYLRTEDGYQKIQSIVRGQTAEIYPQDFEILRLPNILKEITAKHGAEIQSSYVSAINHFNTGEKIIEEVEQSNSLIKHSNILHEEDSIEGSEE